MNVLDQFTALFSFHVTTAALNATTENGFQSSHEWSVILIPFLPSLFVPSSARHFMLRCDCYFSTDNGIGDSAQC
jgi:hypothetical protein